MAGEPNEIDEARIFGIIEGFMSTAALKSGLDLEVFTHIAHGVDTAAVLAQSKKTSVRSMRILCDALAALGLLNKAGGRYSLPAASASLLVKNSPDYIGGLAALRGVEWTWNGAARLTETVRAGHSLLEQGAESPEHPFWLQFQRNSRRWAAQVGKALAESIAATATVVPARILDIACGSGSYGFEALRRFPQARLVAIDWPNVIELTKPQAAAQGLAERVEFRTGDIFSADLGSGYDLIVAANIYHHFSIEKNLELSRRLFAAAGPNATLAIVDMVPDPDRERNRFALMFALTMLIWTREGDTYTLADYEKMLLPAGFHDLELRQLEGHPVQAVLARK